MTTLPSQLEPPAGFWQREASHTPRPLTPLGSSIFIDGVNQSFPKVFADFGLLVETLEWREVGGYAYTHLKPFGAADRPGGRTPPKPILWLVLRIHPVFRRRISRCKRALRDGLDRQLIARWFDEWRPKLVGDIDRLRGVELESLTDPQLATHLEQLRLWTFEAFDVHFYLSGANGFPLARLAWFCREELGYDDMATLALLSGLSGASSEPALALATLAGRIRADSVLKDSLLKVEPGRVLQLVLDRSAELATAIEEYLHAYGFRALRYELIERTLGEDAALVGQLLQDQLRQPVDLRTQQRHLAGQRAEAKAGVLALLPDDVSRARFVDLLAVAELVYPVREDNEFFTISVPLALCRFAAIEASARLLRDHRIERSDDVFFLRWDELLTTLRGRGGDVAGIIAERRRDVAAAEAFDPPTSFGEQPPPPPLDVLPREAREAMEGMLYVQQRVFEAERSATRADPGARNIQGTAAARGSYTGKARVIMGESEFDTIEHGDVLVCPITSPVWSILFAKVGALVTDSGGILSHPAIIAREYGIPAVVATGNGTRIIRSGDQVTVDGDKGTVRILP